MKPEISITYKEGGKMKRMVVETAIIPNVNSALCLEDVSNEQVFQFSEFIGRVYGGNMLLELIPVWLGWLDRRGIKATHTIKGKWYNPFYWAVKLANRTLQKRYNTLGEDEYMEALDIRI